VIWRGEKTPIDIVVYLLDCQKSSQLKYLFIHIRDYIENN
jgi:hypothetical protein